MNQEILQTSRKLIAETAAFIDAESKGFDRSRLEYKGKNDLVSYVDKQAETMLVDGLKDILPAAGFVTEEGTVAQSHSGLRWIIDPLDGTTNFVQGIPVYAVSVALAQDEEILMGVVHEVCRNESFYALKGAGAFCNEQPIHCSSIQDISDAVIATGFPYNKPELYGVLAQKVENTRRNCRAIRRLGSAAVDLAYVAAGRFDAYYEFNLNAWDVAAGALIVREAGGSISDLSGSDNWLFGGEILASNGLIHKSIDDLVS